MSVMSYNISQQGVKVKTPTDSNENMTSTPANNGGSNSQLRKTFNKITVQNVLSENISNSLNISNNSANTIVRKIKDFGMIGTVTNASGITSLNGSNRKRPSTDDKTNTENKSQTPASKKPKTTKDPQKTKAKALGECNPKQKVPLNVCPTAVTTPVRPVGTPGRKGLPLPQAVARRNARERNRVKQVNNGFAALRERIPEEVAEAFEAQGNGRGSAKKLSKVETLRMAVEYIRNLERLLGFEFPTGECGISGQYGTNTSIGAQSNSSSGEDSFTIIKDEFDDLSPGLDDHFEDSLSNYDVDEYFGTPPLNPPIASTENDMLPNITTLNGLPYLRIPGTNTYQLISAEVFSGDSLSPTNGGGNMAPLDMPSPADDDDNEKFSSLIDPNCLSPVADAGVCIELNSSTSPTPMNATTTSVPCSTTSTTPATTNGACVNTRTSSLSRSPVPQQQQHQQQHQQQSPSPLSSPANTSLHRGDQPARLSPAANELSLQTCATVVLTEDTRVDHRTFVAPTPPHQQHQQQRQQINNLLPSHSTSQGMIKQEFAEVDFVNSAALPSPTSSALIYQTHERQALLGHETLSMSPPLDIGVGSSGGNPTVLVSAMQTDSIQSFYDHDPHSTATNTFYESVNLASFKKDLGSVLLDSAPNSNALSDESMIEAIDWWEAHTPKSDSNSVIL